MSKDKVNKLQKYADDIKSRLSSAVPEKHKNHPDTYKRFLDNELKTVTSQLDRLKLEGDAGKK